MKPKTDVILRECLEHGIKLGYRRAHKHNEHPSEEYIFEQIEESVMGQIYEFFYFYREDLAN